LLALQIGVGAELGDTRQLLAHFKVGQ
jgi:hypothetical protein